MQIISFFRGLRLLKFGFSEKATKFEKNLCRTFDKSIVFCARNSVLVKKSTKIFQTNVDKSYYTNFKKINREKPILLVPPTVLEIFYQD